MRLVRSLTSCSRSSVIWVLTARSWRRAGFDPGLWRAASIALIVALIVLIFLALSRRSDTKRPRMRVPRLAWKLLNTCLAFRSMLTIRASLHYCATPAAQGRQGAKPREALATEPENDRCPHKCLDRSTMTHA